MRRPRARLQQRLRGLNHQWFRPCLLTTNTHIHVVRALVLAPRRVRARADPRLLSCAPDLRGPDLVRVRRLLRELRAVVPDRLVPRKPQRPGPGSIVSHQETRGVRL